MRRRPAPFTVGTPIAALVAALLAALTAAPLAAQDERPFRPFDRAAFVAHLRTLGADDPAVAAFAADAEAAGLGSAADDLLQRLVPAYGTAVERALDGDPRAALELATFVAGDDPYLRAHGRYHLGRVFLDADDPEAAVEIFAEFLREDRNRTPLDADVAFFYASALADIPLTEHAIRAFDEYLTLFADAPERYRAVALQRRAELEQQRDNALHGIADQMKSVERDLKKARTGDPTQQVQEDIIEKLQVIIEELEEQERQSSGAPAGNAQSSSPATQSALPAGESRVGTLHDVPGVGARWGQMKDRDREAIEAEVQAKLPARYRELLEGYYERLRRTGGERGR